MTPQILTAVSLAGMFLAVAAIMPPSAAGQTPAAPSLAELADAWIGAFSRGDVDEITRHFAEDAIAHYPAWDRPVVGREANRDAWVSYFSRRRYHPLSVDTVVVSTSDDLGYVLGKGLYAAEDDPDATGARYVAIWQRIGGEWKLVMLAAHSHVDVTPANFRSGM
jgi:ketosteroid isomerase-like protein